MYPSTTVGSSVLWVSGGSGDHLPSITYSFDAALPRSLWNVSFEFRLVLSRAAVAEQGPLRLPWDRQQFGRCIVHCVRHQPSVQGKPTALPAVHRLWSGLLCDHQPAQAEQWANTRAAAVNTALPATSAPTVALVLQFRLSRDWLASLECLSFVLETPDFWALVDDCRSRFPPHQRIGRRREYDAVYGPVTLWPQKLVIKDCDQISFHAPSVVASLPDPVVYKRANDSDPTQTSF